MSDNLSVIPGQILFFFVSPADVGKIPAMDMGLFQLHESTVTDIEGNTRIVRTAHVTGKGQVYFVNCFLEPCQIAWSI